MLFTGMYDGKGKEKQVCLLSQSQGAMQRQDRDLLISLRTSTAVFVCYLTGHWAATGETLWSIG